MRKMVLAVLISLLFGCSSATIPQQIPATLKAACDLYTQAKPEVTALRKWAVDNWEIVPEEMQPTLIKLDRYLPELDAAGQLLCAGAFTVDRLRGEKVDWDDVLSTVIRGVSLAAELKKSGVL